MIRLCSLLLATCFSLALATAEDRQKSSTPGELRTDSTPHSISVEWDLSRDTNHDATCKVQYRQQGSDKWLDALPLFRVDYKWWYHTERAEKALNMFAGSLMFLEPDTAYEVRLDLSDPDGGTKTKAVTVATRPIPKLPQDGRTLHVVPESGGGTGTSEDLFQGLAAAQDAARPGDILLLHKGDYGNHRKRFNDLTTFAAAVGIEQHGVRVRKEEVFEKWEIPSAPTRVAPQHLPLKAGCRAVDAGNVLPNLCDDFVGKAPDLGAYELGGRTPHYGPRQ